MSASAYSDEVKDHFMNPRNSGEMEDPDAVGEVGNPSCGDVMHIFLKMDDDKIDDIKWTTMGCAAAISTSSKISTMADGKEIDEAWEIEKEDVSEALGGLPDIKEHCSNLAADGLHEAIKNYLISKGEWENQFEVNPMEIAEPTEVENYVDAGLTEEEGERMREAGFLSRPNVLYSSVEYLAEKGDISEEKATKVKRYFEEEYEAPEITEDAHH